MQGREPAKTWRVIDLITWTTAYFQKHEIPSARLDAELLLAHVLGQDRVALYVNFQTPVSPEHLAQYRALIKQRIERIPLAYLTQQREFMGLSFYVDPHVLIPRPETEILVEAVEERQQGSPSILEIGTGCGAIAVSLAKRRGWHITATDVSAEALEVARKNAQRHGVEGLIHFQQGNLFDAVEPTATYDWILCNPPYIPTAVLPTLEPELGYEPRLALDGGTDGLDVIRTLVARAPGHLNVDGQLLFEIGHDQSATVCALVESDRAYRECTVIQDYARIERFILARRA